MHGSSNVSGSTLHTHLQLSRSVAVAAASELSHLKVKIKTSSVSRCFHGLDVGVMYFVPAGALLTV